MIMTCGKCGLAQNVDVSPETFAEATKIVRMLFPNATENELIIEVANAAMCPDCAETEVDDRDFVMDAGPAAKDQTGLD